MTKKLILSRKGFDSTAGGGPSPILADGRMVSLPIPEPTAGVRAATYDRLAFDDCTFAELLAKLGYRVAANAAAHLDPDLIEEVRARDPCWRACLGQADQSETHLQRQCVGPGDVFLFWGWFEHVDASLRYGSKQGFHSLFGFLEVDHVVDAGTGGVEAASAYHPHFSKQYRGRPNRVYVARDRLSWAPAKRGWGVFRFNPRLRLTRPGQSRSHWRLPGCFHPNQGCVLSYNRNGVRWGKPGRETDLQVPGRGQEFVCDMTDPIAKWVHSLVEDLTVWTPSGIAGAQRG